MKSAAAARDRALGALTDRAQLAHDGGKCQLACGLMMASLTPLISACAKPRIKVDEWLRVPGRTGAYGIGDVVSPAVAQLPMPSPSTMQAGRYVARSIEHEVRGVKADRKPFRYLDKGINKAPQPSLDGIGALNSLQE